MTKPNTTAIRIREMILQGELKPGARVKEEEVAARLGVSRTPVRAALPALAEEGLLVVIGARGYAVSTFSAQESIDALRARAALEGMAARALAGRAGQGGVVARLQVVLREGDDLLNSAAVWAEVETRYAEMNASFHDMIVDACGMPILATLIARCNIVPFVAPSHVAFKRRPERDNRSLLGYAHLQHHGIVEAIASGDGARAEALFREHAYAQEHSMAQ